MCLPVQLLTAQQVLIGPSGEKVSPGAVLVDGEVIVAVGTVRDVESQAPRNVQRLEFPGGTILPGLINSHVHLAFGADKDIVDTLVRIDDSDLLQSMADRARQHAAAGVTTVRDLGDRRGLITRLRDSIERGELVGPRILAACAPLTPPGGHCHFLGGEVSGAEEIRTRIGYNAELGADVIKVMGNGGQMTPDGPGMADAQFEAEELRLIVEEAHRRNLPVAIHAYATETIAAAVDAGVDTIEHCTFVGVDGKPDVRDSIAKAMASAGIAASPALPSGWRQMWDMLGPERSQAIASRLKWLMAQGVPILFGSDAGVPISQHGDPVSTLELYEHIGVPPSTVLELATTGSARTLGISDRTGSLRAGLAADLVAVDGDPLVDLQALRSPELVLSRGRAVVRPQSPA